MNEDNFETNWEIWNNFRLRGGQNLQFLLASMLKEAKEIKKVKARVGREAAIFVHISF